MANTFTLDDIRAATEAKYGATVITLEDGREAKMINPLRLSATKRKALLAAQNSLSADEEDQEDTDHVAVFSDLILLVSEAPWQGEALIEFANGDLGILSQIFENYSAGTQSGEASASQD